MRPTKRAVKNLREGSKRHLEGLKDRGASEREIKEFRKAAAARLRALRQIDKAVRDTQPIIDARKKKEKKG